MDRVNKECIMYVLDYLHYGTKLKEFTVDFWFHMNMNSGLLGGSPVVVFEPSVELVVISCGEGALAPLSN